MFKKLLILLVALAALFNVVWYTWSKSFQSKQPLSQAAAREYLADYMKRMNIKADTSKLEDQYIDNNGFKLHLAVLPTEGAQKPTIVFVPGTMAYAYWYIEFFQAMNSRGYNIVGLDPRGHGQSSGPRGDYAVSELVDDALAATKYAKSRFGGPVFLVGSSQGGIASFYAAAKDDSLAGVVCDGFADLNGVDNLVLSSLRPPEWMMPAVHGFMNLYSGFSMPTKAYLRLDHDYMKDGTDLETYYAKDPLWVSAITLRAFSSLEHTPMAKPVEKITVPVMLLRADRDKIFPKEYVESIYKRINAPKNFLFLENSEHIVTVNSVDRLVPGVDAWMKSLLNAESQKTAVAAQ